MAKQCLKGLIMANIPYSPVYGYATKEQYERLQELKDGADLKQLRKIIAEQTKRKGEVK